MLTVLATLCKELLELRRDRTGLLVLLVMPMALVLIVSLVQDSVMQATGEAPIRVLFLDRDHSFLGRSIERKLGAAGGVELVKQLKGAEVTEDAARKALLSGHFQFCLIVPPGAGAQMKERLRRAAATSLVVPTEQKEVHDLAPSVEMTVLFDPAVQGTFRSAVSNALQRVMLGIELEEKAAIMAEVLPLELKKAMTKAMGPALMLQTGGMIPEIRFRPDGDPVLKLTEKGAFTSRLFKRPTAAQQNVPAWALFGMFFIVVPLSGTLIRERQTGTLLRLMTMPVSPLALLAGKVCAYVLVCLAQFVIMLAVGIHALPLLGTSGLVLGPEVLPVAVIALCAALAATGYGIMVGTLARTYEQGSMFGAVSVVIAAALGGIMIPVYVMPRSMQHISGWSPLAWGLNAFQDVLVRGGNLGTVLPEIASLLIFFVVTITAASIALLRVRAGR